MFRSICIHALLFLGLPFFLKAQDTSFADLPVSWHLEDCIAYARSNNISLASLRLTARSAEEDLLQSKAAILPDLSGSIQQSFVNGKTTVITTGGLQNKGTFSSNYGLNSSIILYNGGYLKNDIRAKKLSVRVAGLSLEETTNSIILSITQAFFNVLLAQEIRVSFQALLSTSTAQLGQGKQLYAAGSIARKELLQLESQLATDRYNLVNADNNYRLNVTDLKQLLLLPAAFRFDALPPDTIIIEQAYSPLTDGLRIARQTRPEIKNGEVRILLSQEELRKMHAGILPIISLGGSLATGYSNSQSGKYPAQMDNNFYQSIGISVQIPIYSRRVNKTNINKSKILLDQSRLALYEASSILDQQVERVYINLQNARAQYKAAAEQLKISEDIYQITNEQLKLGAVNAVELLQQKNTYIQAIQAYTQAKYTAALYNKIYEFYLGIPARL